MNFMKSTNVNDMTKINSAVQNQVHNNQKMGNLVNSSYDPRDKNNSELLRAFNKSNIFDPKYSTMSSKDRRVPWDGQEITP